MRPDAREVARGHWRNILSGFGVGSEYLSGKHTGCPICKDGKDRFRFDDKDGAGTWICSVCGAGDGYALLMALMGWDFATAAKEVRSAIGADWEREKAKPERDEAKVREDMNLLWKRSTKVVRGDPVDVYLRGRGIEIEPGHPEFRFAERCAYFQDGKSTDYPAMIAMVRGSDGKAATLHRTYLDGRGNKADVDAPRRVMPVSIPPGSAVRLAQSAPEMGISTGIETAWSAALMYRMPVWAALNDNLMEKWRLPERVQRVHIFGDNDLSFSGQAATFALAKRIAGKRVDVVPHIPDGAGQDWNDVWVGQLQLLEGAA
jgi:putative DNA primase/helicase